MIPQNKNIESLFCIYVTRLPRNGRSSTDEYFTIYALPMLLSLLSLFAYKIFLNDATFEICTRVGHVIIHF